MTTKKNKGFDLKSLSTNHNDSSRLPLVDLKGRVLIDSKGEEIFLELVGSDSKIYKDALREKQREMLDNRRSSKNDDTADIVEKLQEYALAKSITGWGGILFDGEPLEHNFENVQKVFEAIPEIKDQAFIFQKDRANFIKTP